jgi:hypothetical protein
MGRGRQDERAVPAEAPRALAEADLPGGVSALLANLRRAACRCAIAAPDFWRIASRRCRRSIWRPGALLRVARELVERSRRCRALARRIWCAARPGAFSTWGGGWNARCRSAG